MKDSITLDKYCIKWINGTALYPNDDPEQAKCHINIGLFYSEVYENVHTNKTMVCSSNNQLFLIILKYLQCSINFIRSSEDYGGRLIDGQWTGILQQFARNESDFIGHIFAIVNGREKVIDQTYLMPNKELISIFSFTKLPRFYDNPFRIFECFTLFIWILIALSLLITGAISSVIIMKNDRRLWFIKIIASNIDSFSLLIGQSQRQLMSTSLMSTSLLFWLIGSFILRQLFSNDFTAILLSKQYKKIDHFDDLFQLPSTYRIMLEPNSSTKYFFSKSFPMLMDRVEYYSHIDIISIHMLDNLIVDDYVLIINTERALSLKEYYPSTHFHVSNDVMIPTLSTYAIRSTLDNKNREPLLRLLKSLYYYGLMKYVDRRLLLNHLRAEAEDALFHIVYKAKKQPKTVVLSGQTILTFIYFYVIGIIISFTLFIFEIIYLKFLRSKWEISTTSETIGTRIVSI
ncbi:hypothetical protein HUG17_9238 [Dermatophagoides farinae]|uniref:Uncharacterized protein n=1 Tax=Dermatophagoides farinae TaxID=6954 RepID=A0A9D4NTM1_DERFA|nr:uncharacterized protein LOC124497287 [Dermatophagoides farinae]XP_046916889.1 uncharacterized protein LOC124497287 [Dermatophagoides farinae]KAH7638133.1 hypothetical protein HUG17_9238 [Dermatophagoides farinae]